MGRRKSSDLRVVCLRLSSSGGAVAEYIFGTVVSQKGNDFKLKNIIKALWHLVPEKQFQNTPQGIKESVANKPRYEFNVDEYFTDYEAEFLGSSITYWREVKSSENLYESYLNNVDAHRQAQAQIEAQRILKEKQAEIQADKMNREQRRKVAKKTGSKKKAPRRKLKALRH